MQTLWVCFGKTTTLGANSQALAKKAAANISSSQAPWIMFA